MSCGFLMHVNTTPLVLEVLLPGWKLVASGDAFRHGLSDLLAPTQVKGGCQLYPYDRLPIRSLKGNELIVGGVE